MNAAKGNVLFIDEAYSLVNRDDDSFGQEAVDSIIAEMENNRDDIGCDFSWIYKRDR